MVPTPVIVTFLLVFSIIGAGYYLAVLRPEQQEQAALRKRLRANLSSTSAKAIAAGIGLKREESPLSAIPVINQTLRATTAVSGPLRSLIERSGLELTVGTLLLLMLCAGVGGYLVIVTLSHLALAALVVGVICAYIPLWFVNFMAKRRVTK